MPNTGLGRPEMSVLDGGASCKRYTLHAHYAAGLFHGPIDPGGLEDCVTSTYMEYWRQHTTSPPDG